MEDKAYYVAGVSLHITVGELHFCCPCSCSWMTAIGNSFVTDRLKWLNHHKFLGLLPPPKRSNHIRLLQGCNKLQ